MAHSKGIRDEVEEKYNKLAAYLKEKGGKMMEVTVFYRVMRENVKDKVVEEGIIKEYFAYGFDNAQFNKSPINGILKGVYFSVRLSKKGQTYILPETSIYGTERIRIPIGQLLTADHQMFFAWQYNTQHKFTAGLVLVDETESNKEALKFCDENLHKLDKEDNPIFCLTPTDNVWKVHVNNKTTQTLEVEIFVVGDIELTKDCIWDTVRFNRLKDGTQVPTAAIKTPVKQADKEVENLTTDLKDMTLKAEPSGSSIKPKANTSTTAKVVAAAESVPATTPITAAPATPPTAGKQAPGAKATTSRQLFPKGDEMEDKTQQSKYVCDTCQKDCHSQIGLFSHKKSKKCLQQNTATN